MNKISNKALVLLKAARKLITPRAKWAQGSYAYDSDAVRASTLSDSAVCWCAAGALAKAADVDATFSVSWRESEDLLAAFNAMNGEASRRAARSLVDYNDERAHRTVLGLFDRVIEANS